MITFSKELLKKLRASLLTAFKLKNIQAYRLATALICYGEGRGIKEIAILISRIVTYFSAKTFAKIIMQYHCITDK